MNSSGPDGGSLRGRCLCVPCANRHYSSNQAMAPASQKEGKINESVQRQMESIPQVLQEFSGASGHQRNPSTIPALVLPLFSPSKFAMLSILQLTDSVFPNSDENLVHQPPTSPTQNFTFTCRCWKLLIVLLARCSSWFHCWWLQSRKYTHFLLGSARWKF